ncbi:MULTISPECIES: hypothetical protein [Bacillus subtilis group]|uniref:hypothetical protein n=1 Tax=Bacillus subtilis group TaxID=653685 RepID=UPI0005DCCA5C|nr:MULTISPECIES: hypothetical protein [Bacillus subtilis group]KJH56491.1 hypothetical protein UF14_14640 [Bacillus licheniformis]MEC2098594.1 hypothetical protein [Bacillus paralicheniformis]MEC2114649.1 hypothetical protein [Bacillus paralicheniformis]MEC2318470.1 hypothetical protein [Bacillus paralicheniformis]VEB19939.1 Uncharacterised protein [Bacillus paralicheniformis]
MKDELVNYRAGGWCYYGIDISQSRAFKETDKVGKFMTFGHGDLTNEMQELILKAIKQGITPLVKHTDIDTLEYNPRSKDGSWMIAWYSTDEEKSLKGLAKFLIDHDLVSKTKSGRYYNISFKYDKQTRMGEYGEQFKSSISLENLMDLNTGEFY